MNFPHFSRFFLCVQCFSSISCYVKQFLGGLHLFCIYIYIYIFLGGGGGGVKESNTLQYLKKSQVQIIVYNKKAVVLISRISNSKRSP